MKRLAVHISGLVQGVGFRPFLYNLARQKGLSGWVRNNYAGVELEIQGKQAALKAFTAELKSKAPSTAVIDEMTVTGIPVIKETGFTILESEPGRLTGSPLPDQAICDSCLREYFNPDDRRYHYPFNSCSICGPRFTIIRSLPFDRERTSMNDFILCPYCFQEYLAPDNRRFHAQTIACPECGPLLWFTAPDGKELTVEPARTAREILQTGGIIAVKGIGGYHLACSAFNEETVSQLRKLKGRDRRPFAVMFKNLAVLKENCRVSAGEEAVLTALSRPIVLLRQEKSSRLAKSVNPGLKEIGGFLPYSGIHFSLFDDQITALVMTSGNRSEEPLTIDDNEAIKILGPMVDGILGHNRQILWRCDDSVVRVQGNQVIGIRRSRGYVPAPVKVKRDLLPSLACGAGQKNTFALTKGKMIYVSPHQGDLDNLASFLAYRDNIEKFKALLNCKPEWAIHDLHPDYPSTGYALHSGLKTIGVQHHLAHLAGVIAVHNIDGPVIGVVFDGSGYGTDYRIWGGEFFAGEGCKWQRLGHLKYYPLPGGEAAIKEPWRMGAVYLKDSSLEGPVQEWMQHFNLMHSWEQLSVALKMGFNSPETSSVGRLFDGIAALVGGIKEVSYEGEAAVWLENQADPSVAGIYDYQIDLRDGIYQVDPKGIAVQVFRDRDLINVGAISMKFHRTVAGFITEIVSKINSDGGIRQVVLSGGVFQNRLLLDLTCDLLAKKGFRVFVPEIIPINDGGIALGQAWLGNLMVERGVTDVLGDTR
jgi:hydrogenase maturation protein HypF